jgi:hypothetical protein
MVAVTGDDDAQVIPPLGASWAAARAAGRPRLWFRGYRGWGWGWLPAERVGELLIRESSSWVRSERDAWGVRGAPR